MEKLREEMQGPAPELPCVAAGGGRAGLATLREHCITPVLAAWSALAGVHAV